METATDQKIMAAALKRLDMLNRAEDYDPNVLGSRPTAAQQEIIDDFGVVKTQWVVAANRSGKSQTCARLISWLLMDTHPSFKCPEDWKREGLLILIAGKNSKQIEESLWYKIRGYLQPGTFKEFKSGNALQKIEVDIPGSEVKHRIILQSMENVNIARERVQSYDAHLVWADEMIDSASAISELRLRVTTKGGIFLCSFTPLIPSPEVKKLIDGAVLPYAKRYLLQTLDNPVFKDEAKKEELMASFVGMSAEEIATRLKGAWAVGDSQVYHFDYDTMVEFPMGYSPLWRHVESVDPAISSALGLTIWAENPNTGVWYCVVAEYLKGILVPDEMVTAVQEYTKNLNVIRRTSDYAPWYVNTAAKMGKHYITVDSKNNGRKPELIKNLQQVLGRTVRISPTCERLIQEFQECRWSVRSEGKMVNSSSFHLLDSAQYFVDVIPKRTETPVYHSQEDYLYQANEQRKLAKAKAELKQAIRLQRRGRWR